MTNPNLKISIALIDLNAGVPNLGVPAIESRLRDAGLEWSRYEPRINQTMPVMEHGAVILSGGPGSPQEDRPWRDVVLSWLASLDLKTPVLGICMGCQLLAEVHGWSLRELEQPRFGVYPLGLTAEGQQDRVLGSLSGEATVFEQRRWGIFPRSNVDGGLTLARSEDGDATAFRFHDRVVGTIFHPEAAPGPVHDWFAGSTAAQRKLLRRHGRGGLEHQLAQCSGLGATYERLIPTFLRDLSL